MNTEKVKVYFYRPVLVGDAHPVWEVTVGYFSRCRVVDCYHFVSEEAARIFYDIQRVEEITKGDINGHRRNLRAVEQRAGSHTCRYQRRSDARARQIRANEEQARRSFDYFRRIPGVLGGDQEEQFDQGYNRSHTAWGNVLPIHSSIRR